MKKILLASVALTAFAGAAAAEVSLTWGGAATVGMAREGDVDVAAGKVSTSADAAWTAADADADIDGSNGTFADRAAYEAHALAQVDAALVALEALIDADTGDVTLSSASPTVALMRADIAALSKVVNAANNGLNATEIKSANATLATQAAILDNLFGSAASSASVGDFDSYSEVNLTATATVTTEYGITVTGAVSVDAGTGYDFADDDGFDAAKTNGVALDYITIDGGSYGALTFDKNDIAHLVDGDDDTNGDLKYTNSFGVASFALVMDIAKDTDVTAAKAAAATVAWDATNNVTTVTDAVAAVAADVAWSAKVSAPVGDLGTVYGAFDEEGGNAFGASFLVSGITIGLDSKLEALEEELNLDRSNTISLAYAVDGLSVGASWNSIEDGNQWSVNAAYAANGMSVAFDTNEADEWTATASYDLSDAASVDLGVNYTEDAFVGLALAF